jgi:hypothetical protein
VKKKEKWRGTKPFVCELCRRELFHSFYDARTKMGPWAILCVICFGEKGVGLGLGKGQKYDMNTLEKLEG